MLRPSLIIIQFTRLDHLNEKNQFLRQVILNDFLYPETELVLEISGYKVLISMHFLPIPTGVRDHNCCNTLKDGVEVCGHVNVKQTIPINHSVVLIDAPGCATISYIVLRTGCNLSPSKMISEKS